MIKFFKHLYPWIICILLLWAGNIPIQMLLDKEVTCSWTISDIINAIINNTEAKIASFLLIIILYIKGIETIKEEKTLLNNRILNEIFFIFAIWIINHNYILGHNLISQSVIEVTFIEVIILIYKIGTQKTATKESKVTYPFASDIPTNDDLFDRKHYAAILLDKILLTKNTVKPDKAFTIFLNEKFGYGKTSFILQVKKIINEERKDEFIYIDYNPWLCENEDAMTKEFFTLLKGKLSSYDVSLSKTIDYYVQNLGLTKNNWFKVIIPNNNSVWTSEEKLSKCVRQIDRPVIVFIDDVDRLSRSETLNLLKMIRNTADFGNIYYIIACDQQSIQQHLCKTGIQNPENYIKKFANFEFVLPANDKTIEIVIEENLRICFAKISSLNQDDIDKIIEQTVAQNDFIRIFEDLRDWKRCLNNITFNLDVLTEEGTIRDVYILDVIYLSILQHVNVEVYKTLRDNDSFLLAISQTDYSRLILKPEIEDYCRKLNLNQIDPEEENKRDFTSISDFLNVETAGKEEHTSYILYRLFGDKHNWRDKRSICYTDSYFKYFSGKNRTSEIPMAAVSALLRMDNDESFKERLKDYTTKYPKSLFHKLRFISEQGLKNKEQRIDLLKKFIAYLECRADFCNNGNINQTIYNECNNNNAGILFANLFLNKSLHLGRSEWSVVRQYFSQEVRISTIISFVQIIKIYDTTNIFLNKRLMDLTEIACSKYKKHYLDNNPFTIDSIHLFLILSDTRYTVWTNTLSEHIKNIKDPYPWLYLAVRPNGSDWEINKKIKIALDIYVKPSLNRVFSERADIDKVILQDYHKIVNNESSTSFCEKEHAFLQEARKWWNDNNYWLKHVIF